VRVVIRTSPGAEAARRAAVQGEVGLLDASNLFFATHAFEWLLVALDVQDPTGLRVALDRISAQRLELTPALDGAFATSIGLVLVRRHSYSPSWLLVLGS